MSDFNFEHDYILEDDRVMLRPLTLDDAPHLLEYSLNEPDTWQYSLVSAAGEDNLKAYIQMAVDARKAGREYTFIVFDKATGRYAGCTRFYDINLPFRTLQLGYTWYGKEFRGTGLNKHCKFLLLRFAFEFMKLERVEFRADNNNARSIAAMKSIGCTVEGVLRRNTPNVYTGGRRDSIILSILCDEWEDRVKAHLEAQL